MKGPVRKGDDSLSVLRGQVREPDQVRQRYGIAIRLLVRDDYTTNIEKPAPDRRHRATPSRPWRPTARTRVRLRGLRHVWPR